MTATFRCIGGQTFVSFKQEMWRLSGLIYNLPRNVIDLSLFVVAGNRSDWWKKARNITRSNHGRRRNGRCGGGIKPTESSNKGHPSECSLGFGHPCGHALSAHVRSRSIRMQKRHRHRLLPKTIAGARWQKSIRKPSFGVCTNKVRRSTHPPNRANCRTVIVSMMRCGRWHVIMGAVPLSLKKNCVNLDTTTFGCTHSLTMDLTTVQLCAATQRRVNHAPFPWDSFWVPNPRPSPSRRTYRDVARWPSAGSWNSSDQEGLLSGTRQVK